MTAPALWTLRETLRWILTGQLDPWSESEMPPEVAEITERQGRLLDHVLNSWSPPFILRKYERPSDHRFAGKKFPPGRADAALLNAGREGKLEGYAWLIEDSARRPLDREQWQRALIVDKYTRRPKGEWISYLQIEGTLYENAVFARKRVKQLWPGKPGLKLNRHRKKPEAPTEREQAFREYLWNFVVQGHAWTEGEFNKGRGHPNADGNPPIGKKLAARIREEVINRAELEGRAEWVAQMRRGGPRRKQANNLKQ